MDLAKRVVLITGAGRRVGRAIALRLARCGARVAVHYHTSHAAAAETVALCRTLAANAESFPADLADGAACASLVPRVLERFGQLDVLVNNASIFERMTLDAFELPAWERTLQVNLTAPAILAHAARDALRRTKGRVINICDAATPRAWPEHLAYIVSKGALETLTRALARALAPDVNVVGIAPGVAAWPEHYDDATRARLTARIPLQRAGSPDDIAAATEYLLRDGDYVTGVVLPVDGGRSLE